MSQQPTVMSRLGSIFRRKRRVDIELPLERQAALDRPIVPRLSIFRPWARRDAAIARLQQGFITLTDLMGAIRDNLEQQNRRQEQLLAYLSHLPQLVQDLPQTQRQQADTLKAISQQLEQHGHQQERLADILQRVGESHKAEQEILDTLKGQVESMSESDTRIAETMRAVSAAMQSVGRSSETSAQVLQQMRADQATRDGELARAQARQHTRLMLMLIFAIILSLAALAAAGFLGWRVMHGT